MIVCGVGLPRVTRCIEELGETSPELRRAVGSVALTVLLSVLPHGITDRPQRAAVRQIEQQKRGIEPAPRSRPSTFATHDQPGRQNDVFGGEVQECSMRT